MDVRRTQVLNVFVNNALQTGDLVMHPNDGFDLGLMNDRYLVYVHMDADQGASKPPVAGAVHLNNACKSGTLQVSQRQWELMRRMDQVVIAIKDMEVFLLGGEGKKQ